MKLLSVLPITTCLAALAVPALGAYCDGMTEDVDWCWNGIVYGRCHSDKLAKSGECDYQTQTCDDLSAGGTTCVNSTSSSTSNSTSNSTSASS